MKMEKLTIEHIAPYLLYGIGFIVKELESKEYEILYCTNIDLTNESIILGANYEFDFSELGTIKDGFSARLLMRPLSSLTKEITQNGETFVPANVLWKEEDVSWMPSINERAIHFVSNHDLNAGLDSLCYPFLFWQLLFSWHFDVFGLIDSGLALPIKD